jgi:transposase
MSKFPDATYLVSWSGLCPSGRQSRTHTRAGKKTQATATARAALGHAAVGAAHTTAFPGVCYGRIARRRGKAKAQVAVARSIWHLLADSAARFTDLGPGLLPCPIRPGQLPRAHLRWEILRTVSSARIATKGVARLVFPRTW